MNKNLYVGNLSAKVTEEDLKSNFSKAGEVVSVNIIRDKFTNQSRGFGFVEMATEEGFVSITTMHLAKGMEFRVVAVMACDDEIIPSQMRIESAADEVDLAEIYDTERHLLYVACTRARDQLHVSAVSPASEFLGDLESGAG